MYKVLTMRQFVKNILLLSTLAAVILSGVLVAPEANAQPLWKKRREAQSLLRKAQQDQRKGETLEAAKKVKRADKLVPKPSTKRRLAKLLLELGDMVQAMEVLREAIDAKPRSWAEKNAVKQSIKLLSQTEDKAPTIEISAFEPEANKMTITLDGEDYEISDGPVARNPGDYTVKATATGYADWTKTVTLAEGDRKTLDITMKPSAGAESDSGGSLLSGKTPAYVAWGVGGLSLGLGIGFGIAAINTTNTVLRDWDCKEGVCPAEAEDDVIAAKTNGNISTAGFVIGGVGIAAGTVLYILSSDEPEAPSDDEEAMDEARRSITISPVVGPAYLGVQGTF